MGLTAEQLEVLTAVLDTKYDTVMVDAIGGSGKSTTSVASARLYAPKTGFYTAFNKAIVEDTKKKLQGVLPARTFHSIAYNIIKPRKSIEELTYKSISNKFSYPEKLDIIGCLNGYFNSSYINIEDYLNKEHPHGKKLHEYVCDLADDMWNGKINPTFDYLLKCMHLMLHTGELEVGYDLIIVDECQDLVPVTFEITKLLKAKKKLYLGDKFQNIYNYMGTVNAFNLIKDAHTVRLTETFRCDKDTAYIVEKYGKQYLSKDFKFRSGRSYDCGASERAYISRTNAGVLRRIIDCIDRNIPYKLLRSPKEVFALPMALVNASRGNPVYDRRYKYLETEYQKYCIAPLGAISFFDYVKESTKDPSITFMCDTVKYLIKDGVNFYDVYAHTMNNKNKVGYTITTAHAFKGLEVDIVYIDNDLNKLVSNIRDKMIVDGKFSVLNRQYLTPMDKENLNIYYVALSRARHEIENICI